MSEISLLKRSGAMNQRFVNIGTAVRPVRPVKVVHLQRWSRIFRWDRTETNLSI